MTQQGKRQARFREWSGKSNTYNGDVIAAGMAASGLDGLTVNEADWWIQSAISGTDATTLSGRQAATAEYLGVPSGWDAVGDELPITAWDFTSGGEFSGLDYNTLVAGARSRDSLLYVPSGQARTSELGLMSEYSSTNKCTNTNMKMTDTTGTTPDGAWTTHEALDLGSIPTAVLDALPPFTSGKLTAVYHSISNAAGTITVDGVTGNINTHSATGWMYIVSGDFGFGVDTAATDSTTGQWIRFGKESAIPAGAGSQLVAGTTQASEAYWFGDQLEELGYRTSLNEVEGSATTRLGDSVSSPLTLPDMDEFIFVAEFQKYVDTGAGFDRVIEANNSSSPATLRLSSLVQGGTLIRQVDTLTNGVYTIGDVERWAFGNDNGTLRFSVGGAAPVSGAYVPPSSFTDLLFGASSSATADKLAGYVRNVSVYNEAATVSAVQRLSG